MDDTEFHWIRKLAYTFGVRGRGRGADMGGTRAGR